MSAQKRRKRPRQTNYTPVILAAVVGLVLVLAGGFAWVLVKRERGSGAGANSSGSGGASTPEVAAAIAETDKLDPNWRLKDIARARTKLDPERNGARFAISAAQQIPGSALDVYQPEQRPDPSRPIPANDLNQVRSTLNSYGTALNDARKVSEFGTGQFEITFNFERPLDTKLETQMQVRKTGFLLSCDARNRAAEGDGAGAVRAAYALLVLARCYSADPFLIGLLCKVAMNTIAIDALEQALTCASVSDSELKALQVLLEASAAETPVLAFRGERAARHATIEAKVFDGGDISPSSHVWFLRSMNRAIELTGKGAPYDSSEWSSFLADLQNGPTDGLRIMPALDKMRDALAREAAILRTSAVAIAAERYRRTAGSWPTELRQLVPNYIAALPTDPYTGNPIKSAQVAQGFTVYVQARAAFASGEFAAVGKHDQCQGLRLLNPNLRRTATGR